MPKIKQKICVVTGTRAEYGLLYWTMNAIKEDSDLELQIIATGMHLSPEFGNTYKEIEKDGFSINKKIEILLSSDTTIGISKSMGLAMISFGEAFDELKPDCIIVLGDRFEIFSAAAAAMIARIPIVHCHGGESTEGLIDEAIRHSITKMSHLHFTSTEDYRNRIIQLGEQPAYVFNVGALGIENINKIKLLSRTDFEKSIDFKLNKINFLVTFHPVTLEKVSAREQMENLLNAIDTFKNKNVHTIFTKANADTDGRIINELIDLYVSNNPSSSATYTSLGQLRYLSAIKHVDVVIGNSSSGLIEVPSFNKPTVNIGDRQKGRVRGNTIIDCEPTKENIVSAIQKVLSEPFSEITKNAVNPYEKGNPSSLIIEQLKKVNFNSILKKTFYNLRD